MEKLIKSVINKDNEDLDLIKSHGLAGFVYTRFAHSLSDRQLAAGKLAWKQQWVFAQKNQLLWNKIDSWGFETVGLKGLVVAEKLYDNLGERAMTDLDLYIDPKNFKAFMAKALNEGFRVETDKNPYKSVFFDPKDPHHAIEVHTQLINKEFDTEYISKQSHQYEYVFVYLIYHLVFQHTFLRLQWLLDIHLLINKFELDQNLINKLITNCGLQKSYRLFQEAHKVIDSKSPPNAYGFFTIDQNFLSNPQSSIWKYLLIKHRKSSLKDSLIYDLNWILQWLRTNVVNTYKSV